MSSNLLRTFFIANPTSGAGTVKREWDVIERHLKNTLTEYDVAFTKGPEHATFLAREALRAGWEMVVAVGGDGTINEVTNGFFEQPDPRSHYKLAPDGWMQWRGEELEPINPDAVLGVIPLGTGGDFRRTMGMMGGWQEALAALSSDSTRTIDLGRVGYIDHNGQLDTRVFINIASGGFSGDVDDMMNRSSKRLGGTLGFATATLRSLVKWRNVEVDIRIDDLEETRKKVNMFIAANGQFFGGGMWIAPGSSLTDGQLQLVTLGDVSKLDLVSTLPRVYSGTHLSHDKVSRDKAHQVAVRAVDRAQEVLLDVDGEQPGKLPAVFHVMPGAIKLKT